MTKCTGSIILIFNLRNNNSRRATKMRNLLAIRSKRPKLIQVQNTLPNPLSNNPTLQQPPKSVMPFFPPPPPGSQIKTTNQWIPPPPTQQNYRQNYDNKNRHQNNYQKSYNKEYAPNKGQDPNRDKKMIVYVKNIPKAYSTQQKLMTFFKNEGVIKQIKVNDVQQSAVIKFVKEQNATKFLKSNKIIFNRSYIIYGDRQNITATQQQINDRINDEQGIVKKAEQTNIKVLKEKVSNQISEQIRAIYFLEKNLVDDQNSQTIALKQEILKQKQTKISIKKNLEAENDDKFCKEDYENNLYDWTIVLPRKAASIEKKLLFPQFLKYGPISNLQYETVGQRMDKETAKKEEGQNGVILNDYRIKILFLGIKSAWTMYSSQKQERNLVVRGDQIKKYFESGKLRIIQAKGQPEPEKLVQNLNSQSVQTSQKKEKNCQVLDQTQQKEVKQNQQKEVSEGLSQGNGQKAQQACQ